MSEVQGRRGFNWRLALFVVCILVAVTVLVVVIGKPCLPCALKGLGA